MHAHLIPRYAELEDDEVAWGIADRFRAITSGEQTAVPEPEVTNIVEAYRAALESDPPPR